MGRFRAGLTGYVIVDDTQASVRWTKEWGRVRTDDEQLLNGKHLRPDQDEISLRLPALRRYVAALRSLTTSLAVQCDLTVDDIEDVQMAIDECCALLLPHVDRSRPWLDIRFHLVDANFVAQVQVATAAAASIDRETLSWTVLDALCDELTVSMDGRSLAICFTKLRGAGRP
jgi:serine/threonine-protein kinase RsbW